jgi:hypothetical protein
MVGLPLVAAAFASTALFSPSEAFTIFRQKSWFDDHTTVVCNAYAGSIGQLKLTLDRNSKRRDIATISYKDCSPLRTELEEGDSIDFFHKLQNVGTFSVSALPTQAETLLLVVSRKQNSSSAEFKSHAFIPDPAGSTQVALIDSFTGDGGAAQLRILGTGENSSDKSEMLDLNTVVAINPGAYKVRLSKSSLKPPGPDTSMVSASVDEFGEDTEKPLNVDIATSSNYVVLHVGSHDNTATAQEDLIVYPKSRAASYSSFWRLTLVALFVRTTLL